MKPQEKKTISAKSESNPDHKALAARASFEASMTLGFDHAELKRLHAKRDNLMRAMNKDCDRAEIVLPSELARALEIYRSAGMNALGQPEQEKESQEYVAFRMVIDSRKIVFRVSKITPTKPGQFVTLWKRPTPQSAIAPLDSGDDIDILVIDASEGDHHGQFIMSRSVLIKQGIMSSDGKGGKRAMRVYPPWSSVIAKEAIKTQKWQLPYFVSLSPELYEGDSRVKGLMQAD